MSSWTALFAFQYLVIYVSLSFVRKYFSADKQTDDQSRFPGAQCSATQNEIKLDLEFSFAFHCSSILFFYVSPIRIQSILATTFEARFAVKEPKRIECLRSPKKSLKPPPRVLAFSALLIER